MAYIQTSIFSGVDNTNTSNGSNVTTPPTSGGYYGGLQDLSMLAESLLPDTGAVVRDLATLTWHVERWHSTGTSVRSPRFVCGGVDWRLHLYPNGRDAPNSVSIFLDRSNFGQAKATSLLPICVQFSIVLSNPFDPANFVSQSGHTRLASGELSWGFERFCTTTDVTAARPDETSAILQDGEADITVYMRVLEDTTGSLWTSGVPSFANSSSSTSRAPIIPRLRPIASSSSSSPPVPRAESPPPREYSPKPPPPAREALEGEECTVCGDKPSTFPATPPTGLCTHDAAVCLECLQQFIASEVNGKGALDGVPCYDANCKETLDYHDMEIWAGRKTFEKYDTLLLRRRMGLEVDFVSCKNTSCNAGQIHSEGANAPIVTCFRCYSKSCYKHQVPWHEGFTCDEWDEHRKSKAEIKTTAEYMTKFTKNCPKCRNPIEKASGCDHMTCKKPAGCGHEFCWFCLAVYADIRRDGNHKHYTNCRYYAPYGGFVGVPSPYASSSSPSSPKATTTTTITTASISSGANAPTTTTSAIGSTMTPLVSPITPSFATSRVGSSSGISPTAARVALSSATAAERRKWWIFWRRR